MSEPITFSDYCQCEIVAAANADQTTLIVSTPTEDFPTFDATHTYFLLTIVDSPSFDINLVPPAQREIVKVTAYAAVSAGYQLTVVRGITTTPQIWAVGSVVELRPCAQALEDLKGSGTFVQAQYVVMSASGDLTSERVLTAGTNITITDNGAGGTVVIEATGGGSGCTSQSQAFTSSSNFTVPANVTYVEVTMIGGGGGGRGAAAANANSGHGGGSGEQVVRWPLPVTPGAVMAVTIGAGGAGSADASTAGTTGGTTSFGGFSVVGGVGALTGAGGTGGGVNGGEVAATPDFWGLPGYAESPCHFGGSAGGNGTSGGNAGRDGGGSGGFTTGGAGGAATGSDAGGGGGGASPYGLGGAGGAGGIAGVAAGSTAYGAGGGGAGANANVAGGAGKSGYVVINWIA